MNLINSFPPEKMYPSARLSSEEFELFVVNYFKKTYPFAEVTHSEDIIGVDGEYNIDLTVRFQELDVEFLVLVECKHHKYPIKRDYVQILRDRVRSIGAQKGILVSSSSFQQGAIHYAKTHNIALVRVVNDEFMYHTRSNDGYYNKNIPADFSGDLSAIWVEATSETSLVSKVIEDFNEVLSISEK
ncbi:restriction endonuclease [Paenibacillus favisporus]|uniref:restriction endonuclease n=1 Tax=Paenibacillus favisporus TaxID=221028 RepID=UPI002DBE2E33|nr:restriction endonuclease [Paenibacillus favisporus]MEC0178444.1 restriction endonuclease [Paenibacillus favisporus]